MSEQTALFDAPAEPPLTGRQRHAYDAIVAAGHEGLDSGELGAIDHQRAGKHTAGDRCQWCGSAGLDLGRALRTKGLVRQRRRRNVGGDPRSVWTVAGNVVRPEPASDEWDGTLPVPYGVIPF